MTGASLDTAVQVHPATSDCGADLLPIFGDSGTEHCWCQYWRLSSSRRIKTTAAYVGTVSMFEAAGFRRVVVTDARSDHLPS